MRGPGAGTRTLRHAALSLVLVAFGSAAQAQEIPISRARALEIAEESNPDLLALRAEAEGRALAAEAAGRTRWPRVTLASGWSRTNTPALVFAEKLNAGDFSGDDFALERLNAPDALSHLTTTLVAEMPVDVFGVTRSRVEAGRSTARAAGARTDEARQDLRLAVIEAYERAALARRVVDVAERAVASARRREADTQARVEQGAALRADLLRVRARRREREAELAERRADTAIADAALARALGAGGGVSYRPTDAAPMPAPLEGDAASWQERAGGARPALRIAALDREAGTWSVRAEERARWPQLAAWGQLQDDRGDGSGGAQSGAFGVNLRWSVLDLARGKRTAAVSKQADAAALVARAAGDAVRLDVETAWRRAAAARERYAAAVGGAEEGREALRVVQERYGQGMATLTDTLETESASLEAELEELRVASDVARADAALRRAVGGL